MSGEVGEPAASLGEGRGAYLHLRQSNMKHITAETRRRRRWRPGDLLPRRAGLALTFSAMFLIPGAASTRWTDNHE